MLHALRPVLLVRGRFLLLLRDCVERLWCCAERERLRLDSIYLLRALMPYMYFTFLVGFLALFFPLRLDLPDNAVSQLLFGL